MKNKLLNRIHKLYKNGENIMSHLRDIEGTNDIESILISYDFQAGTYIIEASRRCILYVSFSIWAFLDYRFNIVKLIRY